MGFSKNIRKALAVFMTSVFILTIVLAAGFQVTAKATADNSVLEEVRTLLRVGYVDKLPASVLNLPTIDEIIAQINKKDNYTKYFLAKDFNDFVDSINNKVSGIGVKIEFVSEGVKVNSVMDKSPALKVGIKEGDVIIMADDHTLAGVPDDIAIGYIKGPEGTTVKLKVKRGNEELSFDVVRKQISSPTVTGKVLSKHIGYISVVSFGDDTAQLFGETIAKLKAQKVDSFIIDLRNNGGGYLQTALEMAGNFIGYKKALITKSQIVGEESYNAKYNGNYIDRPVIFLINKNSASASEVLSSAVKDYGKAYLLGTKSFGKGSVQITPKLDNGDFLKMTIARFYSPKGKEINKVGIAPDMVVADEVDSMRVAELIFDAPKVDSNTTGYVKIGTSGKTVIVKLDRAHNEQYWAPYGQLLTNAIKKGNVAIGNGKGWVKATKLQLADVAKLYYPNYKVVSKRINVVTSAAVTVKFGTKIAKNALNAKNTELINEATGERIALNFSGNKDYEATVVPKTALDNANKYLLVIHPTLLKADKKSLGIGMLNEITTVAR